MCIAHRWTAASGWASLGALPGHIESEAFGVNGDGTVVVGRSGGTPSTGGNTHAFRWTQATGMQSLGTLPFPGSKDSTAYAVSDDGNVIVGSTYTPVGEQPFRWTPIGGMEMIENVSGAASAVTSNGSLIAGGRTFPAEPEACLWTPGGRVDLGKVAGHVLSYARDVSEDGSVAVGLGQHPQSGFHALLWTSSIGMVDLKSHLLSLGVSSVEGWTLTVATGVSGDGLTICGFGKNPRGFTEGWVAHLGALPCYADCDSSGTLNIFDYICFSNAYWAQEPFADCDKNGTFSIFDYSCFSDKYASGCP